MDERDIELMWAMLRSPFEAHQYETLRPEALRGSVAVHASLVRRCGLGLKPQGAALPPKSLSEDQMTDAAHALLSAGAEKWRDAVGYEGLYMVSSEGRVKSVGTRVSPRIMKLNTRKRDGYVCVGLVNADGVRRTEKVHRLVAAAFLLNPLELPTVDHVDHDRGRNTVENLRWASNAKNNHHRAGPNKNGTGVLGVFRNSKSPSKPYRSYIGERGRKRYLGTFSTVSAAEAAYVAAKKKAMTHV